MVRSGLCKLFRSDQSEQKQYYLCQRKNTELINAISLTSVWLMMTLIWLFNNVYIWSCGNNDQASRTWEKPKMSFYQQVNSWSPIAIHSWWGTWAEKRTEIQPRAFMNSFSLNPDSLSSPVIFPLTYTHWQHTGDINGSTSALKEKLHDQKIKKGNDERRDWCKRD